MEKRKRRRKKKKKERRRSSSRTRRRDRCSSSLIFYFFFKFFWGTCLLLLLWFSFFFLTNPFVQDLKLSDLLPIFVLRVLSFLIDLIITSYWCISQNSPKKLKQKETVRTSKIDHGSQNRTVCMGPYFFLIEQFLKLKKLQNWKVHDFSGRTI